MYIKSLFIIFLVLFSFSSDVLADDCNIVYGVYFDYKPYEWVEYGKFKGINIELIDAIAKKADCSIRYVTSPWFDMVDKLKKDEITILSSSINADTFEYAIPLSTIFVQYRIILGREDAENITDIPQLATKEIFLLNDSIPYASLQKANIPVVYLFEESEADILRKLESGRGDFAFVDSSIFNIIENFPKLKIVSDPMFPTLYGFIMKPDSPYLARINDAIDDLKDTGEYHKIINKAKEYKYGYLLKVTFIILALSAFAILLFMLWTKSLSMKVEQKTKESKNNLKLLETILNAIPEIIYIIDDNFRVKWCNTKLGCYFDLNSIRDELAKIIVDFKPTEFSIEDVNAKMWKILILEFTYFGADNFLLIVSDITENVRLRDELFMTTRYSALGEMSAIIAHEINTPLGSAMHSLDYLFDFINEPDDEDIYKAKALTTRSLDKIRTIVGELKRYTNKSSKEYEILDIKECCKSAIGITQFLINKTTSNFSFNITTDNTTVCGSSGQIEQMIINILQNACYALSDNNQKITLTLSSIDNIVKLSIIDEGEGMNDDVLKNACNPYFTTRKDSGGTGLGLSLTSRLMKEHNGRIEIKSKKGSGTEIILLFPFMEA